MKMIFLIVLFFLVGCSEKSEPEVVRVAKWRSVAMLNSGV